MPDLGMSYSSGEFRTSGKPYEAYQKIMMNVWPVDESREPAISLE